MKWWPRSLIARILILELGAILVAAVALPVLLASLLHKEVDRYQLRTLTEQAQAIAGGIRHGSGSARVRLGPDLSNAYASPYDGRAYAVTDAAGKFLTGSAQVELVPWQRAPRLDRLTPFRAGAFIGVSMPFGSGATRGWVIVTQDEAGPGAILDDVVRAFVHRYDPVLVAILLLLPLINSVLIGRLVLAVRAASKRAATIGPSNLDVRLEEAGLPVEVAPLAHATNALLVRLQASFRQQSEFIANVAHELRTPLAAHRVELEAVEDAALRAHLRGSIDRLTHVVAQLQDLATLETITKDRFEEFDATDFARTLVADHAPAVLAAGDSIALEAPDAPVLIRGNRTLASIALSNLLTNASRHTPAGTQITVEVMAPACIAVRDTGPGIAAADPEAAIQRYWRADHQRSDSAGLGLSIVRRIMEVHGGQLTISSTPGRGATFTLAFPPAASGSEGA